MDYERIRAVCESAKCVACGKEFLRALRARGRLARGVRRRTAVSCSKECARIHQRRLKGEKSLTGP